LELFSAVSSLGLGGVFACGEDCVSLTADAAPASFIVAALNLQQQINSNN
jgi:hypothetical protein